MGYFGALQLVGDNWRHVNMDRFGVNHIVSQLKAMHLPVQQFASRFGGDPEGYDSEVDGRQIFRATKMDGERWHVRLCNKTFPDV